MRDWGPELSRARAEHVPGTSFTEVRVIIKGGAPELGLRPTTPNKQNPTPKKTKKTPHPPNNKQKTKTNHTLL